MKLHSITQLSSVNSLEKIQALNALGIYTIRDMAEYAPCRHAEFVMALFRQGSVEGAGLENYIEEAALTEENLSNLDELEIVHLISLNEADAEQLGTAFGVETLSQLEDFPPYQEAQQIVVETIRGEFYEKLSAPPALIPKPIGSTHTQVRFSNYVKEKEYHLDDYELTYFSDKDEPEPATELIDIFYRSAFKFYLGYLASVHQRWVNAGTHLGEIIHSLALAPGESRNIAVLDWYRRQRSSRAEDTTVSEELRAEFTQTRALNEVVQTTANEHLYGSTEVDATTKTTGAGLVGGKASGAATGGSVFADLTSLIGLPLKAASSSVGSTANSIGGSLVYSNGSVQGTLKSETTGERTVTGELVQNISDATVQNASNVRSVMSTVIVEDQQAGRQRAQTRNVTNYNHSHALNVNYYELLHNYKVDTGIDRLNPVLFLPFGPITFNIELIKDYWYIFGRAIRRALPGRFFEFDQVVKDFNPQNGAFDASGDLRITRVKINRSSSYSAPVRVKFYDANPEVVLAVSGAYLNEYLDFKMAGSATYIDYSILGDAEIDLTSFGAVDSFEIDEGITASLTSQFMSELKDTLKMYLGNESLTPNAPAGTLRKNLEDNELGPHSKRDNLKDDVDNDLFSLINTGETIDLTIDLEYTIEDRNGETQSILQSIRKTYTFSQLKSEIDEEIADVTAHIEAQLTIADINPSDTIAEIEGHFNFYKYGYTKYLLANVEKEQIIDVVDHLGIYSATETLALSALIDPNPLGLTENLLIFKLREDAEGLQRRLGRNFFSAVSAPLFGNDVTMGGHGIRQSVIRKGRSVGKYSLAGQPVVAGNGNRYSTANLTLYIDDSPGKTFDRPVEGTIDLIQAIGGKHYTNPVAIQGTVKELNDNAIQIQYTANGAIQEGLQGTIDWTFDFPKPAGEDISGLVVDYVSRLREFESAIRLRHHWESVFLPSSGVFAEAILGLSNASEYLNVRRFFNWQDSPIPNLAPSIQAVNANQDYAQPLPEGLTPTVPVSVLNQIAPQQYPMPDSLTSALQAIQNGSMFTDMSKTGQLTAILGSLAELANNTAQLSGSLAGDAAANALNAAVALGQQVASMVGTAMSTNVADPPRTLTQQGTALGVLDDLQQNTNGGAMTPIQQAMPDAVGTPVQTNGTGSSGNGTPDPGSPQTTEPPPPADRDTSDSIAGTLKIRVALPDPYDYTTVNLLEMIDAFIPDGVDETLYEIYVTLKELVIWLGDDEEKKDQAVAILLKLKRGAKTSGWGLVIGLIIDLLTSETFLNLAEDTIVLLYDTLYYFSHPYLGFAGAHDLGTWLSADIPYTKTRGRAAQVGAVASAPFNDVNYYVGGAPVNSAPNPPTWGVEQLSGSMYVYKTQTDSSKLNLTVTDVSDGDQVAVNVIADQEMMFETVSIVQAIRDDFKVKLTAILANWEATTKVEIEQAVADWLAGLDDGSLEAWLGSWGLPTVAIEAIKQILATAGDLWGTLATFGVDVTVFVAEMVLAVFDYITGFKDLVSGPTRINYHLQLAATIDFHASYPEGWKLNVEGETSRFPALTVSNLKAAGAETVLYSKNDVYPQGLLGLLLACDSIPQKSTYL